MGGDDDGGGGGARDLDQVSPDGLSQQRIHSDCRLVENEEFRLLEQCHGQTGSPENIIY